MKQDCFQAFCCLPVKTDEIQQAETRQNNIGISARKSHLIHLSKKLYIHDMSHTHLLCWSLPTVHAYLTLPHHCR